MLQQPLTSKYSYVAGATVLLDSGKGLTGVGRKRIRLGWFSVTLAATAGGSCDAYVDITDDAGAVQLARFGLLTRVAGAGDAVGEWVTGLNQIFDPTTHDGKIRLTVVPVRNCTVSDISVGWDVI